VVRTVLLRLFGLLVAAVFAAAAAGLLAFALTFRVPWLTDRMQSASSQLSLPLLEGRGMLIGIGLILLATVAGAFMVGRRESRFLRLSKEAKVERVGIARMLQRTLRAKVDTRIGVAAGRRSLVISVPSAAGPEGMDRANEAALLAPDVLEDLGFADMSFRIVAGKTQGRRVR